MIPSLPGDPTSILGLGAVAPFVALLHSEWETDKTKASAQQ